MGKRPNTIVIAFLMVIHIIRTLGESAYTTASTLILGKQKPLKSNRFLRIFHWCVHDGPKNFWKFPTALQIGRSVSTLIQVIFYPKVVDEDSIVGTSKSTSTRKDGG